MSWVGKAVVHGESSLVNRDDVLLFSPMLGKSFLAVSGCYSQQ